MISESLAVFDVLTVLASSRENEWDGLSRSELVTLCYLACITSMYRGHSATDWGYEFVRSIWHGVVSTAIGVAVDDLVSAALIDIDGAVLRVNRNGSAFLDALALHHTFERRRPCLRDAADVLSLFSPGMVKDALDFEPTNYSAELAERADTLLDGPAAGLLHRQLRLIATLLGLSDDAGAAAATYLDVLSGSAHRPVWGTE